MDKFLTYEGQQPIYLGDIDFMQDSVHQTIKQIVTSMTGNSAATCVLYGCHSDGSGGTTAGLISIEGEILPLNSSPLPWEGSFIKIISALSSERQLKSGGKVQCHETRYAILDMEEGVSTANIPYYDYQQFEFTQADLNKTTPINIKIVRHAGLLTISGYVTLSNVENIQTVTVAVLDLPLPSNLITDLNRRTLSINYLTPYTPVPIEVQVRKNKITIKAFPGPDSRTDQYSFSITL